MARVNRLMNVMRRNFKHRRASTNSLQIVPVGQKSSSYAKMMFCIIPLIALQNGMDNDRYVGCDQEPSLKYEELISELRLRLEAFRKEGGREGQELPECIIGGRGTPSTFVIIPLPYAYKFADVEKVVAELLSAFSSPISSSSEMFRMLEGNHYGAISIPSTDLLSSVELSRDKFNLMIKIEKRYSILHTLY